MDHTLRTDRIILVVQVFHVGGVGGHNEIVGAELGAVHLATVAIQELDRHVGAVFGEKGDCLLASLDFHEQFVDRSAFADVVGGSHSDCLVFLLFFFFLKETLQIFKLKVVLSLTFAFSSLLRLSFGFHFVLHVGVHLLPVGLCHLRVHLNQISVHVVHHLARHHGLSVGPVLVLAVSLEGWQLGRVDHSGRIFVVLICGVSENERWIALERQMVLGKFNVEVELVQALVVGPVLSLRGRLVAIRKYLVFSVLTLKRHKNSNITRLDSVKFLGFKGFKRF